MRTALINTVGLNSVPIVYVKKIEPKTGAIYLYHEHDGRDLDIEYANQVFKYIEDLWKGRVIMYSVIEGELWEF